jgi:hypothetical protein
MKKIIFFSFLFLVGVIKGQNEEFLKGFDEKKTIEQLKQKGLDPTEFLDVEKRKYMSQKARELKAKETIKKNSSPLSKRIIRPVILTSSVCNNVGFDSLNVSNWTCQIFSLPMAGTNDWTTVPTWTTSVMGNLNDPLDHGGAGTAPASVPTPNRHVVVNTPQTNNNPALGPVIGYDSIAINPVTNLADIPLVSPFGGTSSLRLGNANIGDGSNLLAETEQVIYTLFVTPTNTQFTFQYAVVLNNPLSGHATAEQPFFQVTVKDQTGNQVGGPCGSYLVTTDLAADTSHHFIQQTGNAYNNFCNIFYKNWTAVTVDLTAFVGQVLSIEFRTADCSRSGHFGYAYIDASCSLIMGNVHALCATSDSIKIAAPWGNSSYQWYSHINTPISGATKDTLKVFASLNDTFVVQMVTPTGCNVSQAYIVTNSFSGGLTFNQPTCSSCCDGSITVNHIGGTGPYQSSLNGGAFSNTINWNNLCAGNYTICVKDSIGCTSCDTISVMAPAGVESYNENGFEIFPNPANNILFFKSAKGILPEQIEIYDVTGRKIKSFLKPKEFINTEDISNGMYEVKIISAGDVFRKKILINH